MFLKIIIFVGILAILAGTLILIDKKAPKYTEEELQEMKNRK